jgi:hypothetical protein
VNVINPGDIKVNYIRILNGSGKFIDVSKIFVSLTIYEDIMSAFVTGSIILSDSIAINTLLPFLGEEVIEINYETPAHTGDEFKYTKTFHIYKIESIENFKQKNAIIELMFMSIDAFVDMNTKISQTFRGSVSDIAKKLLSSNQYLNTKNNIIVEQTTSNCTYTSNFWTPSQNLFYLAGEAYNDRKNPNFVFFENRDGFAFVSMDSLYEQTPIAEFVRDEKIRESNTDGKSVPDTAGLYSRVLDMSTKGMYDYIDRLETGMYGSALYHYDVETKRLRFLQRNATSDFQGNTLNKETSVKSQTIFLPVAKLMTEIGHKSLYPNTVPGPFDKNMRRAALIKRAESFKTNIKVFGRACYKVGDIIDLKVYSNEQVSNRTNIDKMYDPMFSGKYLISALSHEISSDAHYCNLELIRDSYQKY